MTSLIDVDHVDQAQVFTHSLAWTPDAHHRVRRLKQLPSWCSPVFKTFFENDLIVGAPLGLTHRCKDLVTNVRYEIDRPLGNWSSSITM